MMNSINNHELVKQVVTDVCQPLKVEIIDNFQIAFELDKSEIHQVLSSLKLSGWKQLSYLSAVDWPEENQFELVYVLFNWEVPVYIQLRAKVSRDQPVMNSIITIFPGAKYYEREAHEFFGISFPGNPNYEKQLILENWDDLPPLRKDFDPSAYSARKFASREYPDTFKVEDENNTTLKRKAERTIRAQNLRTGGKKQ